MLIKIGIVILAVLGLVFVVLPFFDYAFFDFQCQEKNTCPASCSARTIFPDGSKCYTSSTDLDRPCYKDCQSRNKRCGFDAEFGQNCIKCIEGCKLGENNTECFESCYLTNSSK